MNILAMLALALTPNPDFLIINGVTVPAGDPIAATTVALVNRSAEGVSLCSASLVAADLAVTAGHCVGPSLGGMSLLFTGDVRRAGAPARALTGFARPADFGRLEGDEDLDDIALVSFAGGLPGSYRPASLLQNESLLQDGMTVTLAGFGVADPRPGLDPGAAGAGLLRRVDVRIAEARHGRTEVLLDQSRGRGACHGDSGGPAFLRSGGEYLLFGVTSRGTSDGGDECRGAAIYTSILAQARFLKEAATALRRN